MIVDVWAQPVFPGPPDRLAMPEVARLAEKSGASSRMSRPIGPDELVAEMDAVGVDVLLLSAWHRPGGWVISNDDVAKFTSAYPDRFAGLASIDLANPVGAVREPCRAVHELGFVGSDCRIHSRRSCRCVSSSLGFGRLPLGAWALAQSCVTSLSGGVAAADDGVVRTARSSR
ncbi:MAG TPA: hypothetical protein VGM60_23140 [Pseudonocardia sp.]|jgi:predicted TIM-barrel fold metal-dependent hydrolase|uniref:amidohydrolase family protein n=1 Tax=Pseudonocardia sp. TaxID=60912 RepID=UPI002F41F55C